MEAKRELLFKVKKLKTSYFGHMTRKKDCLEKSIIQGITEGKRSRGKQKRRWVEDIADWTGLNINQAARVAEVRDDWRRILLVAHPSSEGRH